MIIKAGTILTIEDGEYSDFTYHGPFRVLKDLDQIAVAQQFEQTVAVRRGGVLTGYLSNHNFIPFLHEQGYIEDIADHVSWHIGSYGEFDPQ